MSRKIGLESKYALSENVVARDVQGDFVIIPITSGVGGAEDEIFTLNKTGRAIWEKLNGKKNLKDIAQELANEFEAPVREIEEGCVGLMAELLKRKMVVASGAE